MKRSAIAVSLAVFCLAAVVYAVPYFQRAREIARREAYAQELSRTQPLLLDPATTGILSSADRVEAFRLQGGDEDEDVLKRSALTKAYASPRYLQNHFIIGNGPMQGRAFARALQAAVVQGTSEPDPFQCFEPGVGFRAWKGQAHTDICVCFTCQGVEIVTENAKHTVLNRSLTQLGASRPALLALSKRAFPGDASIIALK